MSTKEISGDKVKLTKVNVRTLSHSEEWIKEAATQVEFKPELLETMNDIFGLEKNDLLDIFYDKDQDGNFYKRPAKFDLNKDQISKLKEKNETNRKVNQGYKIHLENLKQGTFILTSDPLMINENGDLNNGGHRITAAFKAEVESIPMMVTINNNKDEMMACDQGKSRSLTAAMKMFFGEEDQNREVWDLCNMASALGYMGAGRQSLGSTNVYRYFCENKSRITKYFNFIKQFEKPEGLSKRSVNRALFLVLNNDLGIDGQKFIEDFFKAEGKKNKLTTLRNSITDKLLDTDSKIINKILNTCYEQSGKSTEDLKEKDISKLFTEKAPASESIALAS